MKFAYMLSAIAVAATLSACANNHNSNAANQAAPDPYGIASLSSSQQQPNVSGTINIRQRVALPPDAVLTVTLSDASLADAPAHVLAYRQHFFRLILSDHIVIQKCFDLLWFQQIDLSVAVLRVTCAVLIYDLCTDFHAFITDISTAGSCNQFPYLFFCLSAERAADLWLVSFYRHSSIPFLFSVLMPKDPRS